ncbi:PREDICTED: glutaminyl-peptide cyclotransferase [Fragaria vesca subsp. vesca]|uniref:glutaminyl-peptide cyclotransferase n=1 Tax=Fragaria vesca subsp. vesca TaxID=101020 RepID=UPI0002C34168|nr:PREDICTED: glutaminyl-peptide cyclotransferase [Fragaria vesca subsp. vesca]
MPTRSLRHRPNKRPSNPKPHTPMAPGRPTSSKSYKTTSLILLMFLILAALALFSVSSNTWSSPGNDAAFNAVYSIQVVNQFPHDPNAFTQGLLYAGNGSLFESTGLYGRSTVRKVDIQTGKVEVLQEMDSKYFGEGLTLLGEKLFQVTWLTQIGFKYDRNDFSKSEKFTHQMKDGWGLATDGKVLFGSDGTSMLYKIDPQTLKVIDKHVVKYKDHEVHNLNELEFIKGEVWANVYQTDCIARISQDDGRVLGWILLPNLREGLVAAGNHAIDVLNGIAWDSNTNRIFVTGKLWPKLYEIKLRPIKKQFKDGAIKQLCLRQTFFR